MLYLVEIITLAPHGHDNTEYRKFVDESLALEFSDRERNRLESRRKAGEITDYIVVTYRAI